MEPELTLHRAGTMALHKTRRTAANKTARATNRALAVPGLRLPIDLIREDWFKRVDPGVKLPPGARAPDLLKIPIKSVAAALSSIVHLVADVRAEQSPRVVWSQGADELLVHLDSVRIACTRGFVSIGLAVECAEIAAPQRVDVGFAVGTAERPTGLLMSSFERIQGPALIADRWSDAITAFAWESLLTTAQELAAATGKDASGRPLLPGTIAAEQDVLLLSAVARHTLSLKV